MLGKKQIKWMLWCFLFILFIKLYFDTSYNLEFIEQSIETEAAIVSVDKKFVGYLASIKFITRNETAINGKVFILFKPLSGKVISIKYNPVIPILLINNSLVEIWFSVFLILVLISFLFFLLYIIKICSCLKKNKDKKLRQEGNHIYTRFKAVEAVLKEQREGRYPYQIISYWYNKKDNKEYLFKSKYLWANPIDYILDQTITVLIDNKNMKKYVMDVSFLPESIR